MEINEQIVNRRNRREPGVEEVVLIRDQIDIEHLIMRAEVDTSVLYHAPGLRVLQNFAEAA